MEKTVNKTVNLQLIGVDGNAFSIMGIFQRQARREGWSKQEIGLVLTEAKSSDYDHLLATISLHCEPRESEGEDE